MTESTYRIRTEVDPTLGSSHVLNVHLQQTYDTLEILSLKMNQANAYQYHTSNYGVVVGRVVANGGFGIPNAKVSIFIEHSAEQTLEEELLYHFGSPSDTDRNGVRYNLLPDAVDSACHQDVGTFPNKRLVLDNDQLIEIFDKYWKFTTTTNEAGDYMLFGVPTGEQKLHVDLDLSDCGVLSQRPRDLIGQGYNLNMFESPNKFKQDTNLNALSQIHSQDHVVSVSPYWGDSDNTGVDVGITRCDINITHKFEPTCVFIGSIVTDKGSNAIGSNCTATDNSGRMSDLSTGEGSIEMIRQTFDGRVEEVSIKGNRLIDGDGVWCYQIPMNLDYVTTDEFGNIVPTDNPDKGIPTRTRVRFRVSMDENPNDASARKRCMFLIPNNPRVDDENPEFRETKEADYEFGSATRDESYRDMMWNKVYTVKSHIPRLQKNNKWNNKKHTGIKWINHFGDNNPMPYNSLRINLSFVFRLICVLTKVIIYIIIFLNMVLGVIMTPFCLICKILKGIGKIPFVGWVFKQLAKPFCAMVISCIKLSSEFCDDGINKKTYYPGCFGCQWNETKSRHNQSQASLPQDERTNAEAPSITSADESTLFTCIENSLAQDNDATSFNFYNDWINGVLYAPLWYRKIRAKKKFLFGLIKRKAKDEWCSADNVYSTVLFQPCALPRVGTTSIKSPYDGSSVTAYHQVDANVDCGKGGKKCHERTFAQSVQNGVVRTKETMLGQTAYYYRAVEYNSDYDDVTLLFATDIVLLGSLNDCDLNGIPQFFKSLESTTYNAPTDILFTDTEISVDDTGEAVTLTSSTHTEATGADWGNLNSYDECGKQGKDDDGGLFYGIGCNSIELKPKSCFNLSRICEFGVTLDNVKKIANLSKLAASTSGSSDTSYDNLIPDGFVSFDELYQHDERSKFATLNGNRLRTRLNETNGLREYDFRHYYMMNFDGGMKAIMTKELGGCSKSYGKNADFETFDKDYFLFRMGETPYFYGNKRNGPVIDKRMPRYENSFYFYFGLKSGKTAIEKFNSQYFAPCESVSGDEMAVGVVSSGNDWCSELDDSGDGYVKLNLNKIATPYDLLINSRSDSSLSYEFTGLESDKIYISTKDHDGEEGFEGYEHIDGFLLNGEYEVIVTDNNGDISSITFTMNANYLSASSYKQDFVMAETERERNFSTMDTLLKAIMGNTKYSTETETIQSDKYGGVVVLTKINNGLNGTEYNYRVSLIPETDVKFKETPFVGLECIATIDEEGKIAAITQQKPSADYVKYDTDAKAVKFVVPKGDVRYRLTVTQLCGSGNLETPNTSSVVWNVIEPIPLTLFVNDINTQVFNPDYFDVGWNSDVTPPTPNINNLKGWDSLSSDDGKYRWDVLSEYKAVCNEEDYDLEEVTAQGYASISDYIDRVAKPAFKAEYIKKIKAAFWLTCPAETKDITLSVSTGHYPVKYRIYKRDDEYSETETNLSVLSTVASDFTDEEDTISSIGVPTLTTPKDQKYGDSDSPVGGVNNNAHNTRLSFGFDRYTENQSVRYKCPYYVGVVNAKDEVIGRNFATGHTITAAERLTTTGDEESGYVITDTKLSKFFAFHIIDKMLRFPMLAWSYFNEMPYFNKTGEEGKVMSANGFLTGPINNGIVDDSGRFESQTLGIQELTIKTISASEDDMPTVRYLVASEKKDEDGNTLPELYSDYKRKGYNNTLSGAVPASPYVEVPNRTQTLTLESSDCVYEEDIYGRMKVNVSGSYSDPGNEDYLVSVKASGGDTNNDITYFIFSCDERGSEYPVNWYDSATNRFVLPTSAANYGVLSYVGMEYDKLITNDSGLAVSNFLTSVKTEEKNDNGEPVTHDGYNSTGLFRFNKDVWKNKKCYFVMAVTKNNCRAVSPVLDFKEVQVEVGFIKTEDGNYAVSVKPSNVGTETTTNLYYLKNFGFTVRVMADCGNQSFDLSQEVVCTNLKVGKGNPNTMSGGADTNLMYYVKNSDNTFTTYSWHDGDAVEVDPAANGGETDFPEYDPLENQDKYKVTTIHYEADDEGELTVPVVDGIAYYMKKGWIAIAGVEDDPSIQHWQRATEFNITEGQYRYFVGILGSVFLESRVKQSLTVKITDTIGVVHTCTVSKVTTKG